MYLTIPASDIKVDDHIYIESLANNENHRWASVTRIKRRALMICITAAGVDLWYRPCEDVQIERFDDVN